MSVGLNAAQARSKASQDMIVYRETQAIMEAIITQSGLGKFEASVDDSTTMTVSTPSIQRIGTVNTPTVNVGDTLIIDSSTITLGTSGTSLNAIISDINDASVPGVTASKDAGYLVLTIEDSAGDEVILPGTDGHLRILSSDGELLLDKKISSGALYTADIAKGIGGQPIIVTAGVDGIIYFLNIGNFFTCYFMPTYNYFFIWF